MKKNPLLTIILPAVLCVGTALADNNHSGRAIGDSRLLAPVPFPGYPEGIAVRDDRVYVSGPAAFGVPGNFVPSTIFVYGLKNGALIKTIAIQNQPPGLNAISCIAFGDDEHLYVLDEQLGVVRINVDTGAQNIYSSGFHPVFTSAFAPPVPVLLNDLAFDKKGNLYITDSFEATIWRVPPGGGAPQVWYSSAAIDGPFGPNGIRIHPKGDKLYFNVTFTATGQGVVYTLPIVDHPTDADLRVFHTYTPGAGPDGVAFGKSGNVYVALAGYSQISVLSDSGAEIARYSGPAQDAAHPANPLPWANPANIAFDDENGRILVTNHAGLIQPPDPSLFAIFDVFVNDKAGKLFGK